MNESSGPSYAIRLHAAWDRKELSHEGSIVRSLRVSLPDQQPLSENVASVIYERKFNAPTGLSDTDRVMIECSLFAYAENITLNSQLCKPTACPESSHGTLVLMDSLQRFNHLAITLPVSRWEYASQASARLLIDTPS